MTRILNFGYLFVCTILVLGSQSAACNENDSNSFAEYWYSSKAEITRYELEQARYGEIRKGDAVLVFVTEDFLSDRQVKYEFGDNKKAAPVLKCNFTRKFYTGVYPYSMMTSVFTPVNSADLSSLKITSSSQEWCGQTFMQINNRGDKLAVQLRSYFQAEGDRDFQLDNALLEDEIWARIRLAPDSLPTGDIRIVPATQFARLRHIPLRVEDATAALQTDTGSDLSKNEITTYTIEYQNIQRTLKIFFENTFPYRILGWEEIHPSGFGPNARMLTTKAVKTHSMRTDYWAKNRLSDSHLREELGIIY